MLRIKRRCQACGNRKATGTVLPVAFHENLESGGFAYALYRWKQQPDQDSDQLHEQIEGVHTLAFLLAI
jgi:hypothetical protein